MEDLKKENKNEEILDEENTRDIFQEYYESKKQLDEEFKDNDKDISYFRKWLDLIQIQVTSTLPDISIYKLAFLQAYLADGVEKICLYDEYPHEEFIEDCDVTVEELNIYIKIFYEFASKFINSDYFNKQQKEEVKGDIGDCINQIEEYIGYLTNLHGFTNYDNSAKLYDMEISDGKNVKPWPIYSLEVLRLFKDYTKKDLNIIEKCDDSHIFISADKYISNGQALEHKKRKDTWEFYQYAFEYLRSVILNIMSNVGEYYG